MDSLKNRILKEYEDLKKNEKENTVQVWMENNDIRHWKGKINGPVSFILLKIRVTPATKAESLSLT
jgi:ubiquitin-protein ligase